METDYFPSPEFGGLDEATDEDGAVKFCLNAVLMSRMFDRLEKFLSEENGLDGFGSDPGWMLERRSKNMAENEGWPDWASFKASVWGIEFGHPEAYYDSETFLAFVQRALKAYLRRYPDRSDDCFCVQAELKRFSRIQRTPQC